MKKLFSIILKQENPCAGEFFRFLIIDYDFDKMIEFETVAIDQK